MSYWVALVSRNSEYHIRDTLDSLLGQTLKPHRIIVVDDGSTDATGTILREYNERYRDKVRVVDLPNRGYDIRRVPSNINLAWKTAETSNADTTYFMISGDDCTYSTRYASTLISRMNQNSDLVVASGRPSVSVGLSHEHSPAGSGRFVRCSFWRQMGSRYPLKAGWETWLLYEAQERGYKVALFRDATFRHVRPRGAKHQFAYWGAAMHGLGYQPLYAVGRVIKDVIAGSVPFRGAVNMLRGYLTAVLGSSDPFVSPYERSLRDFVYRTQVRRIAGLPGALLHRILRVK